MSDAPRSPTEIYRQVKREQTVAHVERIQELEARVARLEGELAAARAAGGTEELRDLPGQALGTLLRVFDAVPIPDLGAFERRHCVQRLSAALEALQERGPAEGGLPGGTWEADGEAPRIRVAEGDGAAVARVTAEVVRVLGEVASGYLAQMIEHQGTTPEHVARARGSHLMDASSVADAKAHYALLPEAGRRELFDDHTDQLLLAKDQLQVVTRWLAEGRAAARELLARRGGTAPRRAPLLALLRMLLEEDEPARDAELRDRLGRLASDYAGLLPGRDVLEALDLADTEFQRTRAGALGEDGAGEGVGLRFLAGALASVLADHDAVGAALRETAIAKREKSALARLAKKHATRPKARAALAALEAPRAAVDDVEARQAAAQKEVVKRFAAPLEAEARARIAASERPERSAAAFERLTKPERTAHLAGVWRDLVAGLRSALEDEAEGLAALLARSSTAAEALDRDPLAADAVALAELTEALRVPPDEDELSLAPPIDVERGLLGRQAEDLEGRVDAFLAPYSRAKKSGVADLADAVRQLDAIDALSRGKRDALDAVLRKGDRGKRSPKREAAAARALLEEQREVADGERRLAAREAAALARVRPRLAALGLAADDYGTAWRAVARARERRAEADAARAALAAGEARARDLAGRLAGAPADPAAARALLEATRPAADALAELAAAASAARDAYLEAAGRVLRRPAADFAAARAAVDAAAAELERADALRAEAERYVARFAARRAALATPAKVTAWVRKERRKAEALQGQAAEAAAALRAAAAKLGALDDA